MGCVLAKSKKFSESSGGSSTKKKWLVLDKYFSYYLGVELDLGEEPKAEWKCARSRAALIPLCPSYHSKFSTIFIRPTIPSNICPNFPQYLSDTIFPQYSPDNWGLLQTLQKFWLL